MGDSMAATIPVPIEFSLPEGWRSVNPDSVDASGLGFVAVHPGTSGAFTANITISGELRESHVPLAEVADEAVERLRAENPGVEVGRREQTGSAENPALTQVVRLRVVSSGKPVQVYQLQVLLGMQDQRDRSRRAVLHVVLSALPAQFAQLIGDFEEFLSTIRPEGAQR
ncbi:hypothetical protein SZMC14600_11198 [Saccharomonospora azurea SZMC 14600]|nr:hypothetical protein SZMC14600_11198 [Saccharomonospora azurea SZMC 14600]